MKKMINYWKLTLIYNNQKTISSNERCFCVCGAHDNRIQYKMHKKFLFQWTLESHKDQYQVFLYVRGHQEVTIAVYSIRLRGVWIGRHLKYLIQVSNNLRYLASNRWSVLVSDGTNTCNILEKCLFNYTNGCLNDPLFFYDK